VIIADAPGTARVKTLAVLGSTGSIGISTLDVVARHPDRFRIFALTGRGNVERMREQCLRFQPEFVVMTQPAAAMQLAAELRSSQCATEVLSGETALDEMARHTSVDYVMAAIVGAAGLSATLAAAQAGKRILLANKEALVMSGALLLDLVRKHEATLIPIDSEHNAIYQCMPAGKVGARCAGVRKVMLTASGGPFLRTAVSALQRVTPEQACAHPRWSMGRKISVDSATLMNKGLELIEACLLFGLPESAVEIVVHPQSIVHSMVEYDDGSVLAQLGNPDMRTPIAHALGWPDRVESGVESLDLVKAARLEFEAPDLDRFPSLRIAREAARLAGTAPAVLNAANEVVVNAFLERRCGFDMIPAVIEQVLDQHESLQSPCMEQVLAADAWARAQAHRALLNVAGGVA
jgi:1-deoxy-D-xylulose-5-phosphate reductoisomerase